MKSTMTLAVTLLLALAACSEKSQRGMTEPEPAAGVELSHDDLRERTLRQGESGRMAY